MTNLTAYLYHYRPQMVMIWVHEVLFPFSWNHPLNYVSTVLISEPCQTGQQASLVRTLEYCSIDLCCFTKTRIKNSSGHSFDLILLIWRTGTIHSSRNWKPRRYFPWPRWCGHSIKFESWTDPVKLNLNRRSLVRCPTKRDSKRHMPSSLPTLPLIAAQMKLKLNFIGSYPTLFKKLNTDSVIVAKDFNGQVGALKQTETQ